MTTGQLFMLWLAAWAMIAFGAGGLWVWLGPDEVAPPPAPPRPGDWYAELPPDVSVHVAWSHGRLGAAERRQR